MHLAIKTGAGGLMDAEFLAQSLCLARGWQEANTMKALRRGGEAGAWPAADAGALLKSYGQLRRMEGILRRWSFEGETLLPDDEPAQHRVAVRCGFAGARRFHAALGEDAGRVAGGLCAALPPRTKMMYMIYS
jgi:glutamine synthetase adenylyltransferase